MAGALRAERYAELEAAAGGALERAADSPGVLRPRLSSGEGGGGGGVGDSPTGRRRQASKRRSKAEQVTISSFEILKPISRGAYGHVVLAAKKTTRDLYAIKVVRKRDTRRKNNAPPRDSSLLLPLPLLLLCRSLLTAPSPPLRSSASRRSAT